MQLRDRIAIVAGGTGGVGGTVTEAIVDAGAQAVVSYLTPGKREKFEQRLGRKGEAVTLVEADLTTEAGAARLNQAALDRHGRVDLLVNLVGGWWGGQRVDEISLEDWERVMAINLRTAFLTCRAVLPVMRERHYGRIVNVASRVAERPGAGMAHSNVSKGGVVTLTKSIALENRELDITCNALMPSVLDTPANRRDMPNADFTRWVRAEQLAKIVIFLLSDDAAPISGAAIPVYGRA